MGAKRDPILVAWLLISVALNVTGLASLVDGAVVWVKFFQQFIDQYRVLVRNPLQAAFHFVWPSSWPTVPGWAFDLLVVWASVFVGTNIAFYRATGGTILGDAWRRVSGIGSFLIFLMISLMMFLSVPFGTLSLIVRPQNYKKNILFPDRPRAVRSVAYAIGAVFAAFILILFVNFQIKRLQP